MKQSIQLFLTGCLMFVGVSMAMAQGPAPPPPLNEVPLDGFSLALLAAGAGYGIRRVMKKGEK